MLKPPNSNYDTVGIKPFKDRHLRYTDLEVDREGFVVCAKIRPYPFDLVELKLKGRHRPISAWWNGQEWEGLRVRKHHTILAWRRHEEYF